MAIILQQEAPDFTLFNSEKEKVSLADFAGKKNVLLLFFPLAFTSVCTKELCGIRDNIDRYSSDKTQVLGISVDSVYTLAKYKSDQGYNFPLLSDFNKEVSALYETIYASFGNMGMIGVSKRSAFIVDKNGLVQYAEVLENAGEEPDFAAIDKKLTALN
ncbi:MAG: redoxin domain-containing protein [Rhizobacter sp.]|nr:redoxin domain-containing protein [Ferruginibacter sp.]